MIRHECYRHKCHLLISALRVPYHQLYLLRYRYGMVWYHDIMMIVPYSYHFIDSNIISYDCIACVCYSCCLIWPQLIRYKICEILQVDWLYHIMISYLIYMAFVMLMDSFGIHCKCNQMINYATVYSLLTTTRKLYTYAFMLIPAVCMVWVCMYAGMCCIVDGLINIQGAKGGAYVRYNEEMVSLAGLCNFKYAGEWQIGMLTIITYAMLWYDMLCDAMH